MVAFKLQTDWYQDEAMTLLESVYLHQLFSDAGRQEIFFDFTAPGGAE